ncbi:hypothetical protein L5515_006237 [Caenorhabditis briggsae]|uniref:Uncharacterized protein n=1 Tax=Caenorhabditis briggsae TaxID=6238 RepID=A0AAE9F3Z8_CAEBR|nr:hypothetical protein L5515_006237 [Caenorhabditis briggsae]
MEMNVVIAQYKETHPAFIRDSWIGIGLLSIVSFTSLAMIVCFGCLIVLELKKQSSFMSATTKRQQTQLIKALVVQTIIPTLASFSPCSFSWYQPLFGIDGWKWLQSTNSIVMSIFPVLDPVSTILILPAFRRLKSLSLYLVGTNKDSSAVRVHTASCL